MMFTTEPSTRIHVTNVGHAAHSELTAFLRREFICNKWVGAEDGSWFTYYVDAAHASKVAGWLKEHGAQDVNGD